MKWKERIPGPILLVFGATVAMTIVGYALVWMQQYIVAAIVLALASGLKKWADRTVGPRLRRELKPAEKLLNELALPASGILVALIGLVLMPHWMWLLIGVGSVVLSLPGALRSVAEAQMASGRSQRRRLSAKRLQRAAAWSDLAAPAALIVGGSVAVYVTGQSALLWLVGLGAVWAGYEVWTLRWPSARHRL